MIHDGKGHKDRTTTLPESIVPSLKKQLEIAKKQHHKDLIRAGSIAECLGQEVSKR